MRQPVPIRLVFVLPAEETKALPLHCTVAELEQNPLWAAAAWGAWVLQTGVVLREADAYQVEFDLKPHPGAINIGLIDTLRTVGIPPDCFVIGAQADRLWELPGTQLTIVQNQTQVQASAGRHWLPHWSQPGLRPRNPDRATVRTVGYAGSFRNFALLPHEFGALCRRCGLEPRLHLHGNWHDCTEIDVLVGIRSFDTRPHDHKPPSKLINAWLAEIPFIGGHDSAFSQLGEAGRDYLRVESAAGLAQALDLLRRDTDLVDRLVAAGRQKAALWDRPRITQAWTEFIENVAHPAYGMWAAKTLNP